MSSYILESRFGINYAMQAETGYHRASTWYQDQLTGTGRYIQINTPDTVSRAEISNWWARLPQTPDGWVILPTQDELPLGWQWGAYYVPCVAVYSERYNARFIPLVDEALSCPAEAERFARDALSGDLPPFLRGLPNSVKFAPCICHSEVQVDFVFYPGLCVPEFIGGEKSLLGKTEKNAVVGTGCSQCGFPGHNSRTCSQSRTYDKVGVELEGRYQDLNDVINRASNKGLHHCGDGSIAQGLDRDLTPQEFQTKPDILVKALRQVEEFYPDEADSSCGMHVHVSFRDQTHFSLLSTEEFYQYFRRRWQEWGESKGLHPESEFFRRLNGKNDYCAVNHERQNPYSADRYMQLNFAAYGEHRTLECRLLPMFRDQSLAISAIVELLSMYEDWLAQDCVSVQLPEVQGVIPSDQIGYNQPVTVNQEISVELPDPYTGTEEIIIPDLPPVPEGMRRIVVSGANRDTLSYILGIAI